MEIISFQLPFVRQSICYFKVIEIVEQNFISNNELRFTHHISLNVAKAWQYFRSVGFLTVCNLSDVLFFHRRDAKEFPRIFFILFQKAAAEKKTSWNVCSLLLRFLWTKAPSIGSLSNDTLVFYYKTNCNNPTCTLQLKGSKHIVVYGVSLIRFTIRISLWVWVWVIQFTRNCIDKSNLDHLTV